MSDPTPISDRRAPSNGPWEQTPRWMFWKPRRRRWVTGYDFLGAIAEWEYGP